MALFSTKKEEKSPAPSKKEEAKAPAQKKGEATGALTRKGVDLSSVLRKPHITEKATYSAERGAYVFTVDPNATKVDVREAVEQIFNVKPVKVNMVRMSGQQVRKFWRGTSGKSKGYKKAYVHLKKGDKIELI